MKPKTAKRTSRTDGTPRQTRVRQPEDSGTASRLHFTATLRRPLEGGGNRGTSGGWTFLTLPKGTRLPSRGMVSVEGTLNGFPFCATFEPDGQGGHWLRVDRKLAAGAGVEAGDTVTLDIAPVAPSREPEPRVPVDLRKALATAPAKARDVWSGITPVARRDWIQWITSGKRAETRVLRIGKACDMLAKGKRRPCCFDRSGMYGNSLSAPCPVPLDADDSSSDPRR